MSHAMMEGKVCLLTGAATEVGQEVALGLAERGATVVLVCANKAEETSLWESLEQQSPEGQFDFVLGDLSDLGSVRRIARDFKRKYHQLDGLLHLEQIVLRKRQLSADGIEMMLATNVLGPFLLTYLLSDLLQQSPSSRIVVSAGANHRRGFVYLEDLQLRNGFRPTRASEQSALLRVMWTYELARRLQNVGVTANAFEMGLVRTRNISAPWFARPFVSLVMALKGREPKVMAQSAIYLGSSPAVTGLSGRYFVGVEQVDSSPASYDVEGASLMWDVLQRMVGIH